MAGGAGDGSVASAVAPCHKQSGGNEGFAVRNGCILYKHRGFVAGIK